MAEEEKLSLATASTRESIRRRSVTAISVPSGMKSIRLSPEAPSEVMLAVMATESIFCSDSCVSMLKARMEFGGVTEDVEDRAADSEMPRFIDIVDG